MPEHAYADVNGVRLHYAYEGAGPLLICLHGFPEFWYEWRNLLPEFDARQNSVELIYEFDFCERRIRKGQKLYQADGE